MSEIKEIYNKFARKYDNNSNCRQDSLGSAIEFASQGYFFAKWNIDLRGKSVLDIGCGTDRVAEAFKNIWNAKVFASDFSKEMAHLVKFRLKERVVVEDALNLCWKGDVLILLTRAGL